MCNEEDLEMATETIFNRFSLDEEASKKIISSPRTSKLNLQMCLTILSLVNQKELLMQQEF
ncbi:hypothetical protein KHA80_13035 [Anaerobacillus sp. HL2]|nr:hypothetical protein KHA80_13035 [Anaerobacillus sp. HL2]